MPVQRAGRVLKLYEVIRTAHLERITEYGDTVTVLYRQQRYDFDRSLAEGIDLQRAGVVGAFLHAARHDLDFVEVNEPLMLEGAARAVAVGLGNRLRALTRRGPRAKIVTYAIENKDPRSSNPHYSLKVRVRRRVQSVLLPLAWRQLDRVAFGTDQAEELYRTYFGSTRTRAEQLVVPAVPAARPQDQIASGVRDRVLVFLGALTPRKGLPQVLRAWPSVRASVPDARLIVVGKGSGADEVRRLAADEAAAVEFTEDPPRSTIFEVLGRAKVLVLPSQPTPTWREQVGLPIIEGLASGCTVVATGQTGLADWLSAHGHVVVDNPSDEAGLAEGLVRALTEDRSAADVLSALPAVDGREAAERWLFGRD